ncbi:hypothetical protein K440DRAFT_618164 [Wilcoxina mikolae CBS 423.85]|nr:hypothetical protein K440DRAFT_618164 [Wilcoxina mikolae CBS 423.85]
MSHGMARYLSFFSPRMLCVPSIHAHTGELLSSAPALNIRQRQHQLLHTPRTRIPSNCFGNQFHNLHTGGTPQ